MSTKKKPCKKESKLIKCLKAPLRMLCLAQNFYVKALTECSDHAAGYGAGFGCPTGQGIYTIPRSFSTSSSTTSTSNRDEDYRELVRAASSKSPRAKNNVSGGGGGGGGGYYKGERLSRARSANVAGIGRIDEDKPCDFEEDSKSKKGIVFLPRSKSSAPFKRGTSTLV